MIRRLAFALLAFILLAAACSSAGDDNAGANEPGDSDNTTETAATEAPEPEAPAETEPPAPTEPAVTLPDYSDEAAALPIAPDDRSLPPEEPELPIGSYGFSRYVYSTSNGEIVPTLVEGPRGRQVRCQQSAQDCSYTELKALLDSGDPIPDYLEMDRETLAELVSQLDRVNAAVLSYDSIDDACAAGFTRSTNQNANMGIHMIDQSAGNDFNPDQPQMVLFAKADAERLNSSQLGRCVDGRWTGEDGFQPVGAVFNIELTEEHPDAFAGQIDNWHIHYNTCIGRSEDISDEERAQRSAEGARGSTTLEQCQSAGGLFLPIIPSWMMHAYVVEDFDAQSGVFSMFNPSIWPIVETDALRQRGVNDTEGALDAPITNFDYGNINATVGEPVRFSNSDDVPHTVTAGSQIDPSDAFDSGVLGTGQSYDVTFDEPGDYQLFCVLHPDMTATVSVSE